MKTRILKIMGRILGPKFVTYILYRKTFGKSLNLKNPQTINEKIHWLKFYGDTSQWPLLADKYRVREYVTSKGLQNILVKLYGVYEKVDDINWETLPNQFVLKMNNGCGDVTICHDKYNLETKGVELFYKQLLKQKFGIQTGQIHYKYISPCVIAEELLDSSKQDTESTSLIDYKIWCFNGNPQYILLCINREKGHAYFQLYDTNWLPHPEFLVETPHFSIYNKSINRPTKLNEMLQVACILSDGHPQMRVDLYLVEGKIYFGELTLTSACGYMNYFTTDFLNHLGDMCSINTACLKKKIL